MLGYLVGSATVSRSAVDPARFRVATPPAPRCTLDAIQAGLTGPRVVGADLAFSASNTNGIAAGFSRRRTRSELQLYTQPDNLVTPFVGKHTSARGAGLELGLAAICPRRAPALCSPKPSPRKSAPPQTAGRGC